jgi:sulfite exporter TauE/SafE
LYNSGRILTYSLIGLTVGWFGSTLAIRGNLMAVTRPLLLGSDILVILVGLGSAGLFSRLNLLSLEFSGPISSLTGAVKGLRKLPPGLAALPFGILFGFLPCGLLYAMALTAAQSADSLTGAIIMEAFGLGTAPSLLLVGGAASWFSSQRVWMMKAAGIMVALMGSFNLFRHIRMMV